MDSLACVEDRRTFPNQEQIIMWQFWQNLANESSLHIYSVILLLAQHALTSHG